MIIKESNSRSKVMYKEVLFNYIFRGVGIILGLLSTSINLGYLGLTLFGQWATIASIASWINYGDFGIGNGLRNELASAVALNNEEKQKKLIVSTAKILGQLSIILLFLLIFITEILFATDVMSSSLRIPMYITNFFFCLDLFFGIGRSVAYGYQMSWLTSLAQCTTIILRIIGVLVLKFYPPSLIFFALINGFASVIGNFVLISVLIREVKIRFKKRLKEYIDNSLKSSIIGVGIQFFILQISCIVLYSTDNLIINKIISPEAVTKYDLISKIYYTGENLFAILLISLWSAVTYAIANEDYDWIRLELKRLLKIWLLFAFGVIVVSFFFNEIIQIWLGHNSIKYEWSLICLFAVYTIWGTFGSIFVNISNGMGRLKLQLIFCCVESIVNIPLSIFLASTLGLGIFGVKLATLFCCIGANLFVPIDIVRYLIHKKGQTKSTN